MLSRAKTKRHVANGSKNTFKDRFFFGRKLNWLSICAGVVGDLKRAILHSTNGCVGIHHNNQTLHMSTYLAAYHSIQKKI